MKLIAGIFGHPPKGKLLIPQGKFLRKYISPKSRKGYGKL